MYLLIFMAVIAAVVWALDFFLSPVISAALNPYLPVGWQDRLTNAVYLGIVVWIFFNVYGRIEKLESEVRGLRGIIDRMGKNNKR